MGVPPSFFVRMWATWQGISVLTPDDLDNSRIIRCKETVAGRNRRRSPRTMRALGEARIVGRDVLAWSAHLGSYGMGGYGFFGLRLAQTDDFPVEWLILTLFGAGDWLLLDDLWISAAPMQWATQRPLTAYFGMDGQWDELSPLLIGARLVEAAVADTNSQFTLQQGAISHRLEVPADAEHLPYFVGTGQPRRWNPRESLRDAWVISESGELS